MVALTAEKNDPKVTFFLAGDGVMILNCKKAKILYKGRFPYKGRFFSIITGSDKGICFPSGSSHTLTSGASSPSK